MQTKFIVVVPFHNVRPFINECANSLISQKYRNWKAIFSDDASTDNGHELIPNDPRIVTRRSEVRQNPLGNIHSSTLYADASDNDVICILDGDDYLIRPDALDILSSIYSDPKVMLTYGQYINTNGSVGHCRAIPKEAFEILRRIGFWASHMRTYRFSLYKELMRQDPDLICYKDEGGNFYSMCADVATMTPLMEIAGYDRVRFNHHPIYFYRQHPGNEHAISQSKQKHTELQILAKNPFERLK